MLQSEGAARCLSGLGSRLSSRDIVVGFRVQNNSDFRLHHLPLSLSLSSPAAAAACRIPLAFIVFPRILHDLLVFQSVATRSIPLRVRHLPSAPRSVLEEEDDR